MSNTKKGQKEAVIFYVECALPTFRRGVDVAILLLSNAQLESIKSVIGDEIANGNIEYSKDPTNAAEVRTYARSMVMNHLKKAKELNGGTSTPSPTIKVSKAKDVPKGVNLDLLPEELKDFAKSLV